MKVNKHDVGKFVRVQYDDVGACDGILVDYEDKSSFKFFSLSDMSIISTNGSPVIKIGNYITAKESGL